MNSENPIIVHEWECLKTHLPYWKFSSWSSFQDITSISRTNRFSIRLIDIVAAAKLPVETYQQHIEISAGKIGIFASKDLSALVVFSRM